MRQTLGPGFPQGPSLLAALCCDCQSLTSALSCRLVWAPHGGTWLGDGLSVPHRLSAPHSLLSHNAAMQRGLLLSKRWNHPEISKSLAALQPIWTTVAAGSFIKYGGSCSTALTQCRSDSLPGCALRQCGWVCAYVYVYVRRPFWRHTLSLRLSLSLSLPAVHTTGSRCVRFSRLL